MNGRCIFSEFLTKNIFIFYQLRDVNERLRQEGDTRDLAERRGQQQEKGEFLQSLRRFISCAMFLFTGENLIFHRYLFNN